MTATKEPCGFIEVTILRDETRPNAPEHKATISVSAIREMHKVPEETWELGGKVGTRLIVCRSRPAKSWLYDGNLEHDEMYMCELWIREAHNVVSWLVETANTQHRIVTPFDFEETVRPVLRRPLQVGSFLKFWKSG